MIRYRALCDAPDETREPMDNHLLTAVKLRHRLAKRDMFYDIVLGLSIGLTIVILAWGYNQL